MYQKLFIAAVVACLGHLKLKAQHGVNPTFAKGTHLISFGYGVPNIAARQVYFYNMDQLKTIGPVYGRYEYGINDVVGLGVQASYSAFSFHYNEADGTPRTDKGVAKDFQIFGSYHFGKLLPVEKLDLYATAGLGMWSVDLNSKYRTRNQMNDDLFHLSIKGGARYYFAPFVAGYAQLGFDKMSILDLGLTFNLNPQ